MLVLAGRNSRAADLLVALAEELAADGFFAKAVAVLKKVQRIEPERAAIEPRLAELLRGAAGSPAPPVPRRGSPAGGCEPTVGSRLPRDPTHTPPGGLGRSPLLAHLPADELADLIRGFRLLSFEPGEILMTEGERGESLFVLASGGVRVYVHDRAGANRLLRNLGEGEFFGEIALATHAPRSATVTAAERCQVLELHREVVRLLEESYPGILATIEETAGRRAGSPEEHAARRS